MLTTTSLISVERSSSVGVGYVALMWGIIMYQSTVDIVVDNCAICRNHIMDLCKRCKKPVVDIRRC